MYTVKYAKCLVKINKERDMYNDCISHNNMTYRCNHIRGGRNVMFLTALITLEVRQVLLNICTFKYIVLCLKEESNEI